MPKPQPSSVAIEQSDPKLGDAVTFAVEYPDGIVGASIQISAYQDGALVFGTAGLADRSLLLGGTSSPWLERGGPAHCVATLYWWKHGRFTTLASTEFDAAG